MIRFFPAAPVIGALLAGVVLFALGCEKRSQPALDESSGTPRTATAADGGSLLFPVETDSLWGYIDRSGSVVIEPQFDRAWRFSGARALIQKDGQFGFIDTTGTVVIEPQYADAWHFSDGVAPVQTDSLWGFIDPGGEVVVSPSFGLAPAVVEEGASENGRYQRTRVDGRYGYRSEDGRMVIEPRFEQAWTFSDGRARVRRDGRWGYIDRRGQVVIEPRFQRAWDFRHGLARVETASGRLAYIDTTGTQVWPRR
jgi:hypothetical protein